MMFRLVAVVHCPILETLFYLPRHFHGVLFPCLCDTAHIFNPLFRFFRKISILHSLDDCLGYFRIRIKRLQQLRIFNQSYRQPLPDLIPTGPPKLFNIAQLSRMVPVQIPQDFKDPAVISDSAPHRERHISRRFCFLFRFRAQYLVAAFPVLPIGAGIDFKQTELPISMVIYCAFRCIHSAGSTFPEDMFLRIVSA